METNKQVGYSCPELNTEEAQRAEWLREFADIEMKYVPENISEENSKIM